MAIQSFEKAFVSDNEPFVIFRSGGRRYDGFLSSIRIDRKTVPPEWHVYDLREGEDGFFGEIRNGYIFVNHLGTFATKDGLGLGENDELEYCGADDSGNRSLEDREFDYSFE